MRAFTLACASFALLMSAYTLGSLHGQSSARQMSSACEMRAIGLGANQATAIYICN